MKNLVKSLLLGFFVIKRSLSCALQSNTTNRGTISPEITKTRHANMLWVFQASATE